MKNTLSVLPNPRLRSTSTRLQFPEPARMTTPHCLLLSRILNVIMGLVALLLVTLAPAPLAQAENNTIVIDKKACDAATLPPNIATDPAAPSLLAGCQNLLSVPAHTLVYYVISLSDLAGGQTINISDALPSGFSQLGAPTPFCVGVGCPSSLGAGPSFATITTGLAGSSAYVVIPGYFTAGGYHSNTALATPSSGDAKSSLTHEIYVGTPKPPPGNLSVKKESNITSAGMAGGSGSITVHYTITVTNTGTSDLNLGGIFELVDQVTALPGGSLGFDYVAQNFTYGGCVASPAPTGSIACPTLQGGSQTGMTTNSISGATLGVWSYPVGDAGTLPNNTSYTISFDVKYTLNNTIVCVWPDTIDGVRNTAYIRFANGQTSFSDTNVADNTSFVDLEVNDTGITDNCEQAPPDKLKFNKVQKSPQGIVPWGTPVDYLITVTNTATSADLNGGYISTINLTDSVAMLPGMPLVDVVATQMACVPTLPPGTACNDNQPPTGTVFSLNTYNAGATVAAATITNLGPGQSVQVLVTIIYKPRSCVSYESDSRQTEDIARYDYKITGKYGMIYSYGHGSSGVITDHDKVPHCTLKSEKTGPKEMSYGPGNPVIYQVTYENTGDDTISVGTLTDSISLSSDVYAPSVSGSYTYGCAYFVNDVPQPWGPANLVPGQSAPQGFSVAYNAMPGQGTRLLHNLNAAAPIVFPPHSKIVCDIKLVLDQPGPGNPYCQGAGEPKLVNSAFMDVTSYFNTNFNPNSTTPPSPYDVHLPQAYADTAAGMPLCHRIITGKSISPMITGPGSTVTITLTLQNAGDDPITGATLADTAMPAGLTPNQNSFDCPLCTSGGISGQSVAGIFGTLNGGQTGTITFTAVAGGPAPRVYTNTDDGHFEPPPGNWYDGGLAQGEHATFNMGVFDMEKVVITKQVVNTSPLPFPQGPFPVDVHCTLPGYPQIVMPGTTPPIPWHYDYTANLSVPGNSSFTLPDLLPAGAVCTFSEASVPNGTAPYGFSAVGYEPAAGSGLSGVITVTKGGPNTATVENCYGTPGHLPALQTPHVVGEHCPPPPEEYSIRKFCDPAVLGADGESYVSNCHIDVGTSGQFPVGYTVQEELNGVAGEINFAGSTPSNLNWSCDPSPTAAPGPLSCSFTGGTQANPGPNTATLFYTVTFKSKEEVGNAKNCAIASLKDEKLGEDCIPVITGDDNTKYDIEKRCGPVSSHKYAIGPAATGIANFSDCVITVKASGPVYGTISVTDNFTSAPGNSAVISALTAAGWTCIPSPAPFTPVSGPFTCTMPGAMFPSTGTSTITATVMLPVGENSVSNCATVLVGDDKKDKDCTEIVANSNPKIEKTCEKPYQPVGSTNWQVNCRINVTPTGPISGTVTVNDVMSLSSGGATITGLNAGPWNCTPSTPVMAPTPLNCTTNASNLPASIGVTMSVPPNTTGLKNCADVALNGQPTDNSCVDIVIPPPPSPPDIEKKCEAAVWNAVKQRFEVNCGINISVPAPGYANGYIYFTEIMSASGAAATLDSLTQSGWTCQPPTVPPVVTTPVQVACKRPAAGFTSSSIAVALSFPQGTQAIKNCAYLYWDKLSLSLGQLAQHPLLDKSCYTVLPVDISHKASIDKTCTDARLLPAPNPLGLYGSTCTVTVNTAGPVPAPVAFSEVLSAAGTTTFAGSTPAGWTCAPSTVNNNASMQCSFAGTVSPVSNSWNVTFNVTFPNAAAANGHRNCVRLRTGSETWNSACHTFTAITPTPPTLSVTKNCVVMQQYTDAVALLDCTITVTASGTPLPPVITVTENLQSTNTVPNSYLYLLGMNSTDPGWSCPSSGTALPPNTPLTCTIPGSAFPVSGTSTIHAYMYSDANITPGSTQNCASVSGNSVPPVSAGPACVPIGPQPPTTGQLTILKYALLNGQPIAQQMFPFTVTCGGSVSTVNVYNDTGAGLVSDIPFGTTCNVQEDTPPTAGVCPPGQTASWSTAYVPSALQPFSAQVAAQTVTVTNTLTCTPPIIINNGRLTVKKVIQVPAGTPNLNAVYFPVTVTCGGSPIGSNISVNAPLDLGSLSTTAPCTVVEGTASTTGLCPPNTTASWSTSYSPTGAVTPSLAGATVTVLNKLICSPAAQTLTIDKTGPATCAAGAPCVFTITITNTGAPVNGNFVLADFLSGNASFTNLWQLSSVQPSLCGGTGTGNGLGCVFNLSLGTNQSMTFTVTMVAGWPGGNVPADHVTNCAGLLNVLPGMTAGTSYTAQQLQNLYAGNQQQVIGSKCIDVHYAPPQNTGTPTVTNVTATKTCSPVTTTVFPVTINCVITVTGTSSPLPPWIQISENLFDSDPARQSTLITSMSSPQAGWTLPTSFPIHANVLTPVKISGANLAAAGGTSTINVTVQMPDPGTANIETKNCIQLKTLDPVMSVIAAAPEVCANFSVTVPQNIVLPPTCDNKTAKLVGKACACTVQGMKHVSATACACPAGTSLKNGRCVEPPPPPLKCDPRSAVLSHGKCLCKVPGAVLVSPTACACPDGTELLKGKCRVPKPAPQCDPRSTVLVGDVCQCRIRGAVKLSETQCGCPDGTELRGGRCRAVQVLECPEGTILRGNLCIRMKPDPVPDQACPPGTRKVGPLCLRIKSKGKDGGTAPADVPVQDSPPAAGKLCVDRDGKPVPCN